MKIAIIEGKRPSLLPEGPVLEKKILGNSADISCYGDFPVEKFVLLESLDAVIVRPGTLFTKEHIDHCKKAKAIVSIGVGYDHIDWQYAREKNIPVCNVPDYGTEEVADTSVTMILNLHRKLNTYFFNSDEIEKTWDWKILEPIQRLSSCRVGIVGLGRIGTAVALRMKAFGCQVSYFDPYLPRGVSKALNITQNHSLAELLSSSDIVSIHAPLNEETSGLINHSFLSQMKKEAILVNCSRGKILSDLDTLFDFLKLNPQLRVGLDVLPDEPPFSHPLFQAWKKNQYNLASRLIINPHSAFYSVEAVAEIRMFAAQIVKHILAGNKPYNQIN